MGWIGRFCFAAMFLTTAPNGVAAQPVKHTQEQLAKLASIRTMTARMADDNVDLLRTFQFNRAVGASCVYEINGMFGELEGQIARIEALVHADAAGAAPGGILPVLIKVEAQTAIGGIDAKRRRAQLSAWLCATIPVLAARAQVAVATLDQAEEALAAFR